MYWTHLIFALTLGLLFHDDPKIAKAAGYLDFDNLPETNFSCKDKVIGGYYADVETGCQMFHVCTIGQKGTDSAQSEVTDIKFLCLNGTVFDQETRVCERIDEVDCSKSEDFFNLNLELYGNQAGGIQPEEEFFCEDCSTEEDDYADVTTRPTPTTTTTTTTTTTRPTTTTTRPTATPTQKAPHYQTSNPETIAALIALHNAFSQSVQNPKVKSPPPRVINNAFAGVTPSTPRTTYFGRPQVTQLPPRDDGQYEDETDHQAHQSHRLAPHDHRVAQQDQRISQQDHRLSHQDHRDQYTHTQTHHGNLQASNHHKGNYYQVTTPSNLKANYHHFQSGDSGFVHSFDTGKQYNYQYFHPRKHPEPTAKASVSIVTSTSTSTSIRATKTNDTLDSISGPGEDFPTGYDDYPDDSVDDAFFRDVPKLRTKRSEHRHSNHRYPEETTTPRHRNHRYDWSSSSPTVNPKTPLEGLRSGRSGHWPKEPSPWQEAPEPSVPLGSILPEEENPTRREAFLQNLLGSLDMDEHDRQKMAHFFKVEEKGVDQSAGFLHQLGNKLGELIMDDINKTIHQAQMDEMKANASEGQVDLNKIDEMWRHHYQEMSQEVDLTFDLGSERDRSRRDAAKNEKLMEELAQDYELVKAKIENVPIPQVDKVEKSEIKRVENEKVVDEKPRIKRQVKGLDTEKFTASHHEPRKRLKVRPLPGEPVTRDSYSQEPPVNREIVPVFEEVDEGDFTTRPYVRLERTQRPRLTTRSVDNTVRLKFDYELTTPSSGRNKANSRSVTGESLYPNYGAQPRLTPPSVTRDVSKLKDTPVYEESDFADSRVVQLGENYPVPQFVQEVTTRLTATSESESTTAEPEISTRRLRRPSGRRTRPPEDRQTSRQLEDRHVEIRPRIHSQDETQRNHPRDQPAPRSRSRNPSTQNPDPRPLPQRQSGTNQPRRQSIRKLVTKSSVSPAPREEESETENYPQPANYPSTRANSPSTPANYAQTPGNEELHQPTTIPETQQQPNYPQPSLPQGRYERVRESSYRGSVRDRDFAIPAEDDSSAEPKRPQARPVVSRGKVRGTLRSTTPPNEPPPAPPIDPSLVPDPNFSCDGKIKGSFYADVSNDCKGFFICSQGQIDGPLLKSHFWCGTNTKFNQRSRTCQDETLVECSVSSRYYHLNQDFAIPETEEQLKPAFEPLRDRQRG